MYKYRHERLQSRMDHVQYMYKIRESSTVFENFVFPIVIYNRDGTIAAANKDFRDLAKICEADIQLEKLNILDYIDNNDNYGLEEAVHMAFGGVPNVYISDTRIIRAETGTPLEDESMQHPNVIFYPMTYDQDDVKFVGILLDDNQTAESETID